MQEKEPALVARGIRVCSGATTALDAVDIDLRAGEVHAVVGENGAGKPTLLAVLAGAVRMQSGPSPCAPAPVWPGRLRRRCYRRT
jgi:ABC-type sugar transport system ATPase subunit